MHSKDRTILADARITKVCTCSRVSTSYECERPGIGRRQLTF